MKVRLLSLLELTVVTKIFGLQAGLGGYAGFSSLTINPWPV